MRIEKGGGSAHPKNGLRPRTNSKIMDTANKKTVAEYIHFLAKPAKQSADVASVKVKNKCTVSPR